MNNIFLWVNLILAIWVAIANWLTEDQRNRFNQKIKRCLAIFFGVYFSKILLFILCISYTALPIIMTIEVLIRGEEPSWSEIVAYVFILFMYSIGLFRLTIYQKWINKLESLKNKVSELENRLSMLEQFKIDETATKVQRDTIN